MIKQAKRKDKNPKGKGKIKPIFQGEEIDFKIKFFNKLTRYVLAPVYQRKNERVREREREEGKGRVRKRERWIGR